MSHLVVFFVFFFKQKTAYEMRISDWSSDVCSSDLSRVASDLRDRGATVFALKSDFLSPEVSTETDLQRDLQLPGAPSDLILRLAARSEEHTSELQSLMRISYAVFCLKKKHNSITKLTHKHTNK